MLAAALFVAPSDLWYVGDNPAADIAGAREFGVRAVWLNASRHEYPPGLQPPTAVIEHLDALAGLVRGA